MGFGFLDGDASIDKGISDLPELPHDMEVAMKGRLQQNILTTMRPFIDHVDQLFSAVETLGGDLAKEQARSRQQHNATSLRLNNLEKTISSHFAEFANVPEKLNQRLELVEQRLEEVNHVMSRVEERLNAPLCDWQKTADALRQDFRTDSETLIRGLHSNSTLHMDTQERLEAFDRCLNTVEEDARFFGTNAQNAEKFDPILEKQRRNLEKVGDSMQNMKRAVHEVASKLAHDGHHTEKPDQHDPVSLSLATDAKINLSGKAAVNQHPCNIRRVTRSPLPTQRTLKVSMQPCPNGDVSRPHSSRRMGSSSPRMQELGSTKPSQGPTRPLGITAFPGNLA